MTRELDGDALRAEILSCYGVELRGELFRGGTSDAARVLLADRLAGVINGAAPSARAPRVHRSAGPSDWAPLPSASATPGDPARATARLLAWAIAGGADVGALEIRTSPTGYRTAHARRDVVTGERIVYVPHDLLFDVEQVRRTPIGEVMTAPELALASEHTPLAVALVAEHRNPESRWRPYLDALPHHVAGLPMFESEAALAPLAGSAVIANVVRARRALLEDHGVLVDRLKPHVDLRLADLAWARAICSSRAFAITIGGVARCALIPIADIFDHGAGDVRWAYDDDAGGLVITAIRDFVAGDEVHLSYGLKTNARLFASYGFCLPDNPADVAQVVVPRPEADVRGDLIARLLWDRTLGAPWEVQVSRQFDDDTALALSQARLAVATERELMVVLDSGRLRDRGLPWLSERNEVAAWAALAAAATARLAEIPTVQDEGTTPYMRALKLLLAGERQVLEALIDFVADVTPLLLGASRWDLRRLGDAAAGRLLAQYLHKLATELP